MRRVALSLCLLGVQVTLAGCGGTSGQHAVDLELVSRFRLNAPQSRVLEKIKGTPIRVHTAVGTPDRKHPHRRATYTCYAYRVLKHAPTDYVELCFALNKLQSVFSAIGTPTVK